MTGKQETGQAGENLAQTYLLKQGYRILETNWRFGHLEVDIIALDNQTIVFVEVKTRGSSAFGQPSLAVNLQKQRNIIRAANSYVTRHNYPYEVRFDIISIVKNNEGNTLEHLKDAYTPKW
ncbi:MAG: YraN family protein [Bacteroidales bacterium]|nr:YraN family protein [Bacteroidales bacterium]